MSNLTKRILTALIAGSIAVTAIVLSVYGMWLFCVIVSLAGMWEFLDLADLKPKYRWPVLGMGVLGWGIMMGHLVWDWPLALMVLMAVCIVPFLALYMLFQKQEKAPAPQLSTALFSFWYPYLPMVLLLLLAWQDGNYDFRIPLGILITTWALDVGAFFGGKWFGKRKLFPRISPKKTWAGSIGGGLICLIIAGAWQYNPSTQSGIAVPWLVIGVVTTVFGQWGDLIESMFKRSAQKKDSGSLLPGHGGMLDRFDGMYITLPLLYVIFSLWSHS